MRKEFTDEEVKTWGFIPLDTPPQADFPALPTIEQSYTTTESAYLYLHEKTAQLARYTNQIAEARRVLETAKTGIILGTDPKVLGANEEQRKAALASRTAQEADMLMRLENSETLLKCEVECARIMARLADRAFAHISLKIEAEFTGEESDNG